MSLGILQVMLLHNKIPLMQIPKQAQQRIHTTDTQYTQSYPQQEYINDPMPLPLPMYSQMEGPSAHMHMNMDGNQGNFLYGTEVASASVNGNGKANGNGNSQLEFKYKCLEHDYAVLENQFQLYSSQTFNRIQSLQRDMDNLVAQKDKAYTSVCQQNKSLKQQITKLRIQCSKLQSQIQKSQQIHKKQQSSHKQQLHGLHQLQLRHRQLVLSFQSELAHRTHQLETVKQILNNQRIHTLSQQHKLQQKQKQIIQLLEQIRQLELQLEKRKQVEERVKLGNLEMRKEVQQLWGILDQGCDKCNILDKDNARLRAAVRDMERQLEIDKDREKEREKQERNRQIEIDKIRDRQRLKQNRRQLAFSFSRDNRRTIQYKTQSSLPKRHKTSKYLGDFSMQTIKLQPQRQPYYPRAMKDSVLRRCRLALQKN